VFSAWWEEHLETACQYACPQKRESKWSVV